MLDIYWFSAAIGVLIVLVIKKILSDKSKRSHVIAQEDTKASLKEETKPSTKASCGSPDCCQSSPSLVSGCTNNIDQTHDKVTIIYGTTTGKSKHFAKLLSEKLKLKEKRVELMNAKDFGSNIEDKMKEIKTQSRFLIVIISTYTEGTPPESAKWFYTWLSDMAGDFRVSHNLLSGLEHSVFGLGNSLYSDHYNSVGKDVDSFLTQLGSAQCHDLGLGDENVANSVHGSQEADFEAWANSLVKNIVNSNKTDVATVNGEDEAYISDDSEEEGEDDVMDIEDLGMKRPTGGEGEPGPKEMVTPMLRKTLTKQGYKIIGSHSGVKLCRWTKSMLRGRGGCYKHTFYGIDSHRCMETTPSLACANKCVFCWRHHSNPVGTEWRWKMESAEFIFQGAVDNHRKMINEFKGVPGVLPEKLVEGMTVKHCALSLVGEPIMYPEINKFVKLLHNESISSFLVTNAQFPEAIRDMDPVTQLYVSVDASTKESLKKIDRPLFKDFWERFLDSLKELKEKGQRTVYRLTLVKGWNAEEMDNYAKLVMLGQPDFIEIKGVTFCGSSKASTLTMENVPWHSEVVRFVSDLVTRLTDSYSIASEHEHSNCILVAHNKFRVDNEWKTWIDYDRFHELIQRYYTTGETFSSLDYMATTPAWAVFGAQEQGFDPQEKRWFRKGKAEINVEGGCG